MSDNYYPPIRRSRVEQHTKRRRTNTILNILIFLVSLGILVVGWQILFGHEEIAKDGVLDNRQEEQQGKDDTSKGMPDEKGVAEPEEEKEEPSESTTENRESGEEEDPAEKEQSEDPRSETGGNEVVTEPGEGNVLKVVIDPSWEPVGTVQTGTHVTQYDKNSVDWQEMLKALSYATGVSSDNMIVHWIGRGEIPNKQVVGTIQRIDTKEIYRVYLDWVDGRGWKPTKMEMLKELDINR